MPLPGNAPISSPIVFDINIATNQKHQIIYGVKGGKLDSQASFAWKLKRNTIRFSELIDRDNFRLLE